MKQQTRWLRRGILLILVLAALCTAALAAGDQAALRTPGAFYQALEEHMLRREERFTLTYGGDLGQILRDPDKPELGPVLRDMAAWSTDSQGSGGDYCTMNVYKGSVSVWNDQLFFNLDYLTTPEEEAWIDQEAARLTAALDLDQEPDATKVKLIYEYVAGNYVYDNSLQNFSAYDGLKTGTMVCQGYAILLYKMLWQAGVPCRIVAGVSQGENHAWNVAQVDGQWYNLDATWDAATVAGERMSWTYFLKNQEDFEGHTRFDSYETRSYRARVPMAAKSYPCRRVELALDGSAVSALTIRKGVEVTLQPSLDGRTDGTFTVSSTHPEFVSASADGKLSSIKPGQTTVVVRCADDRGILPAMLPVTAVDLTSCADWAGPELNAYYLRGYLPASLAADLESPLTRGELARLLYQLASQTRGIEAMSVASQFEDLESSEDWYRILACVGLGFFEGTSEKTFSPDAPVTREQAAKVLLNAAAYCSGEELSPAEGTPVFQDADRISPWARGYVLAAQKLGILQGDGSRFSPDRVVTRQEMLVALERLCVRFLDQPQAA